MNKSNLKVRILTEKRFLNFIVKLKTGNCSGNRFKKNIHRFSQISNILI